MGGRLSEGGRGKERDVIRTWRDKRAEFVGGFLDVNKWVTSARSGGKNGNVRRQAP